MKNKDIVSSVVLKGHHTEKLEKKILFFQNIYRLISRILKWNA